MSTRRQYTIVLTPDFDDQVYTVTVPALPGIVTEGATVEEAIEMAKDAIRTHVEGLLLDGEDVPEETMRPQAITLDVDIPVPAASSAAG
jgi:predicted RNase H-like HicB family nuclease